MKLSIQTGDLTVQYGVEQGYKMIADAGFEAVDCPQFLRIQWEIGNYFRNKILA